MAEYVWVVLENDLAGYPLNVYTFIDEKVARKFLNKLIESEPADIAYYPLAGHYITKTLVRKSVPK